MCSYVFYVIKTCELKAVQPYDFFGGCYTALHIVFASMFIVTNALLKNIDGPFAGTRSNRVDLHMLHMHKTK